MGKSRLASWEVSDEFWSRVEPLLPPTPGRDKKQQYARAAGAGRKRKDPRLVFAAIVYVLRTGGPWKAGGGGGSQGQGPGFGFRAVRLLFAPGLPMEGVAGGAFR